MGLNTEIGGQVFTEKGQDTLWELGKEPTSSVLIAMIPMSQNSSR
jgi:hypothetical protein